MVLHHTIDDRTLRSLIRQKRFTIAGNTKLKIYGLLNCYSGKRMHRAHRVFFSSQQEAIGDGYRPCGHCMKPAYQVWKQGITHTPDETYRGSTP